MSDFVLSGFVKSMFDGYRNVKKDDYSQQFSELDWTPFLFSSDYLNDMYSNATTKEQHETILDYLYRHNATEVSSYQAIEQQIIDKYFKPERQKAQLYSINGGKKGWRR